MPMMAPGYGPPGMPPFQAVAMPTGQPMGFAPGSIPGMPPGYAPQIAQPSMAQAVAGAYQPMTNTGSPAMMSKTVN